MTHAKHPHQDSGGKTSGGDLKGPYWKRAHHDWKFWVALVLMLTSMGIYIVTLDLSLRPTEQNNPNIEQRLP